jgi:hypothetical protein
MYKIKPGEGEICYNVTNKKILLQYLHYLNL